MPQTFPVQNMVRPTPIQFNAPPPANRNPLLQPNRRPNAQAAIQVVNKDAEAADASAKPGWTSSSVPKLPSQSPQNEADSNQISSSYGLFNMQFGAPTSAT